MRTSPFLSHAPHIAFAETNSTPQPLPRMSSSFPTIRTEHEEKTTWRSTLVESCAQLLGKSVPVLRAELEETLRATNGSGFANRTDEEHAPRDLADYVIMNTLKSRRASSSPNVCSWFFNLMDRTGYGYVLREEFVRYSPYMSPIADAAIANTVFELLLSAQQENNGDDSSTPDNTRPSSSTPSIPYPPTDTSTEELSRTRSGDGLRRRRPARTLLPSVRSLNRLSSGLDRGHEPGEESASGSNCASGSADQLAPSRHLYPLSIALQFPTWNRYYLAVLAKYYAKDSDWERVKREVGIDANEVLIKSEGALVHADLLPTVGKLYLSQRYLVFHAAIGRNHYVARLGAISNVRNNSIPYLMRDCFEVFLNSEIQAALEGVTAATNASSASSTRRSHERNRSPFEYLPQHIGNIMRQFTSCDKPLSFSLMEFRDTSRRDNWVAILKELVSAYRLHIQMGFGATGRASPLNLQQGSTSDSSGDAVSASDDLDDDDADGQRYVSHQRSSSRIRVSAYEFSPFRDEPPTPLLVVAAQANIARYRALRHVTKRRRPQTLLIFSYAERHTAKVNWYVDSVRKFDSWNEKSWIDRLVSSIRENISANQRVYRAQDEQPFDLRVLATSIGRLAELCEPLARSIQFLNQLFQWQNPPATVLAILACSFIAIRGYVQYVPAMVLFGQACWIVETRLNWFGVGMARRPSENVEEQQQNVLQMVAQVRDALQAAQNVIARVNVFLGKVQTLFLWRAHSWQSWVAVATVLFTVMVLIFVPAKMLFMVFVSFMFGKHFLPPSNPALRFWEKVPSRIDIANNGC